MTLHTSLSDPCQILPVVSLIPTRATPLHWRSAMLRIYKHYSFELQTLRPAAARMSFSSYPGELFSDDDFYILSSGLVILQADYWERGGGPGEGRALWEPGRDPSFHDPETSWCTCPCSR